MSYRDEARRALESNAARSAHDEYLRQIQNRYPELMPYADVEELLCVLRDPREDADRKDAALLALLDEHQRGAGGGAFALLVVAMFPALDRIYRTRVHLNAERDDLWGRVVGAFVEALDRYPTARRRSRVAANIEGETMAAMRRAGLREARAALARERLAAAAAPFLEELAAIDQEEPERDRFGMGNLVAPGGERAAAPEASEFKDAEEAVTPIFEAGGINERDRFLILGVHLYQRRLGDLAAELGISRAAAKKRHLRAITRLRSARKEGDDLG